MVSRCTRSTGPGIDFFQILIYVDDADDAANDDAGYVGDDDGRNRFISTTTVGPRAFKLSSGLPALCCLRLPASHHDHRNNRHFVVIFIKIIIIIIEIIVIIVILSS